MNATSVAYIEVPGARLAFSESGADLPVRCVHGWPFHGGTWGKVAERMKGSCRMLMPDLVGAGATVCGPDARDDMASQTETKPFTDALGLSRRPIPMQLCEPGHSGSADKKIKRP